VLQILSRLLYMGWSLEAWTILY